MARQLPKNSLSVGANVAISDMAPEAPEMEAEEGKFLYVKTDVTKPADVEAMVEKVKETYGTIDVLVNNAGINIPRLLVDPKDPKDSMNWMKLYGIKYVT